LHPRRRQKGRGLGGGQTADQGRLGGCRGACKKRSGDAPSLLLATPVQSTVKLRAPHRKGHTEGEVVKAAAELAFRTAAGGRSTRSAASSAAAAVPPPA